MKAKTQEFLYMLLWTADMLCHPTYRNIGESFEGWAYSNGLMRQIALLERQYFLESQQAKPDAQGPPERIVRLTEKGRLAALGGRDPQAQWSRPWDGLWRWAMFDIAIKNNPLRDHLRHYLRSKAFGCLQQSLWVTPDPWHLESEQLADTPVEAQSLILLEGRPCAGETDSDLVSGAWDFESINRRYAAQMKVLGQRPEGTVRDELAAESLHRWAAAEQKAWLTAVSRDPLLPERLLPEGYLGQRAWQRRVEVLGQAGRQIQSFHG